MCTEKIITAGEVRVSLNEEAVEHMCERGFSSGGIEDRVNCADMEGERTCSRSEVVQGHYAP